MKKLLKEDKYRTKRSNKKKKCLDGILWRTLQNLLSTRGDWTSKQTNLAEFRVSKPIENMSG